MGKIDYADAESRSICNTCAYVCRYIRNTHVWYCPCRKLNSSFIRSSVSAIVNLMGPCDGGPCETKARTGGGDGRGGGGHRKKQTGAISLRNGETPLNAQLSLKC